MIRYLYRLSTGETLTNYCKTHKLSYSTVYGYMLKGFSVDEAIEHAKNVKNTRKLYPNCYTHNGESVYKFFKNDRSKYTTIIKHMREKNLTASQAIEFHEENKKITKPRNVKKVINLETGEIFKTIKECAENIGTTPYRLSVNLKNGWKTRGLKIVYYNE